MTTKKNTPVTGIEAVKLFSAVCFARDENRDDDTREPLKKLKELGYSVRLVKPTAKSDE